MGDRLPREPQPLIPVRAIGRRGLVLWSAALAAGCGGKSYKSVPTYPVSGTVVSQGVPVEAAYVKLAPVSGQGPTAQAVTDAQGRFVMSSYVKGDGAAKGSYHVLIVWPAPPESPRSKDPGPDRLKGRLNNPRSPQWTVDVADGENVLPPFDFADSQGASGKPPGR